MTWYVETLSPMGTWSPSLSDEKPQATLPGGSKRTFRAPPVEVPATLDGLPLGIIARVLSPDGDLAFVPHEALAAFLRDQSARELVVRAG